MTLETIGIYNNQDWGRKKTRFPLGYVRVVCARALRDLWTPLNQHQASDFSLSAWPSNYLLLDLWVCQAHIYTARLWCLSLLLPSCIFTRSSVCSLLFLGASFSLSLSRLSIHRKITLCDVITRYPDAFNLSITQISKLKSFIIVILIYPQVYPKKYNAIGPMKQLNFIGIFCF